MQSILSSAQHCTAYDPRSIFNQQTVNQQQPSTAVREYKWGTNSTLFFYIHLK